MSNGEFPHTELCVKKCIDVGFFLRSLTTVHVITKSHDSPFRLMVKCISKDKTLFTQNEVSMRSMCCLPVTVYLLALPVSPVMLLRAFLCVWTIRSEQFRSSSHGGLERTPVSLYFFSTINLECTLYTLILTLYEYCLNLTFEVSWFSNLSRVINSVGVFA